MGVSLLFIFTVRFDMDSVATKHGLRLTISIENGAAVMYFLNACSRPSLFLKR